MKVYGGHICGAKRDGPYVATGPSKGHFQFYVCDREPHENGDHRDSNANKTWR